MEWVLNIWSLCLLSLFILAYFALRNRQALRILAFTHFYVIDTLFTIAFTIFFCVKWFKNQKKSAILHGSSAIYGAASTARDINGSTGTVIKAVGEAVTVVKDSIISSTPENKSILSDSASLGQESAVSIILTVALLLARIYFSFVIIGFARQLVRQQNLRRYNGTPRGSWSYMLQSILLGPFESFWTGVNSSSSSFSPLSNTHHFKGDDISDRAPLRDSKFEIDDEESLSSPSSLGGFRLPSV